MTDIDLNQVPAINLYCDGACEPKNPGGVATYGWIMYERLPDGKNGRKLTVQKQVVADGGKNATNNFAEYCGLGFALRFLKDQGYPGSVHVFSDSKLLVHQVLNEWKCNKPHLQKLRARIWELADEMKLYRCTLRQKQTIEASKLAEPNQRWLILQWIPREQNEVADELSKQAFQEYRRLQGKSVIVPRRRKKKTQEDYGATPMHCAGCGWTGTSDDLVEDEGKDSLVCPICNTSGVVVD